MTYETYWCKPRALEVGGKMFLQRLPCMQLSPQINLQRSNIRTGVVHGQRPCRSHLALWMDEDIAYLCCYSILEIETTKVQRRSLHLVNPLARFKPT